MFRCACQMDFQISNGIEYERRKVIISPFRDVQTIAHRISNWRRRKECDATEKYKKEPHSHPTQSITCLLLAAGWQWHRRQHTFGLQLCRCNYYIASHWVLSLSLSFCLCGMKHNCKGSLTNTSFQFLRRIQFVFFFLCSIKPYLRISYEICRYGLFI